MAANALSLSALRALVRDAGSQGAVSASPAEAPRALYRVSAGPDGWRVRRALLAAGRGLYLSAPLIPSGVLYVYPDADAALADGRLPREEAAAYRNALEPLADAETELRLRAAGAELRRRAEVEGGPDFSRGCRRCGRPYAPEDAEPAPGTASAVAGLCCFCWGEELDGNGREWRAYVPEETSAAWAARERGREAGRAAASWTEVRDADAALRWLRGLEEGDPEWMDAGPAAPDLSGEMADADSGPGLVRDLLPDAEDAGEALELLAGAWDEGAREGYAAEQDRILRYAAGLEEGAPVPS